MRIWYKHNREPLFYDPQYLTTIPHDPPEPPRGPFAQCAGCPYSGHGFVCWGRDKCLRSEMARIMERDQLHIRKDRSLLHSMERGFVMPAGKISGTEHKEEIT